MVSDVNLHPYTEGGAVNSDPGWTTVMRSVGQWVRAEYEVEEGGAAVRVVPPSGVAAAAVTGVRYAWEKYPQCALYNGAGGASLTLA